MAIDNSKNDSLTYTNPAMDLVARLPGVDIFTSTVDRLLTWGSSNSLWMFPMATSCCGIEFMASATARVDIDPPLMMALEMQATRGDHAEQILQWRKRDAGLIGPREARALATDNIGLVRGRLSVGVGDHRLA